MEQEGSGGSGGAAGGPVVVDTKGKCLFCLKKRTRGGGGGEVPSSSSIKNFSLFSKVVQLDIRKVIEDHHSVNLSTPTTVAAAGGIQQVEGVVGEPNAGVTLCAGCSAEVGKFSNLVSKLTPCVRNILDRMITGDERRKKAKGGASGVGGAVVDSLRAEVISKCTDWANRALIHPLGLAVQRSGNKTRPVVTEASSSSSSSNTQTSPIAGPSKRMTTPQEGRRGGFHQGGIGAEIDIVTQRLGTEDFSIEFAILPLGLRRCTLCSKTVTRELMGVHAGAHIGNSNNNSTYYKCSSCQESFRCPGGLRCHTVANHRHTYFSQFKYPSVDTTRFNRMVEQVFLELDLANTVQNGVVSVGVGCGGGGGGGLFTFFTCSLCQNQLLYSQKVDLDSHLIEHHMETFGSRLMVLQEEELRRREASGGGPGPSAESNAAAAAAAGPPVAAKRTRRSPSLTLTVPEAPPPDKKGKGQAKAKPEVVVRFTAVSNLDMQCQMCTKIVPAGGVGLHAPSHQGWRPQLCPNCQLPFIDSGNLRRHNLLSHRAAYLSHFRDPRLAPAQFASIVEELFDGFQFSRDPVSGLHQCCFVGCCSSREITATNTNIGYKRKADLYGHLIHDHMPELGSRVLALQENVLERGLYPNLFLTSHVSTQSTTTTTPPVNTTTLRAPGGGMDDEGVVPPPPPPPPSLPLLTCTYCGELFSSRNNSELVRHLVLLHSRRSDLLCDLCVPSSSSSTTTLFPDYYHLRNHSSSQHLAHLLSQLKDARLSEQEFLDCVTPLINRRIRKGDWDTGAGVEVGGYGGGGVSFYYYCDFCQNGFRSEEDAVSHVVYNHKDDIGGELVMAQNEYIGQQFSRGQGEGQGRVEFEVEVQTTPGGVVGNFCGDDEN